MKKTLSILLAILFLLTTTPIMAQADNLITNVAVTVEAPMGFEDSSNKVNVRTPGCQVATDYNEGAFRKGVCWRDVTEDDDLMYEQTFVCFHVYEVRIVLKPKSGYLFSPITQTSSEVPLSATINGQSAEISAVKDYETHERIMIRYRFPATKQPQGTDITRIVLKDIVLPTADTRPAFKANAAGTGYAVKLKDFDPDDNEWLNGVCWFSWEGLNYMDGADYFTEGYRHRVGIWLATESGYRFSIDKNSKYNGTLNVNGKEVQIDEKNAEVDVIKNGAFVWLFYDLPKTHKSIKKATISVSEKVTPVYNGKKQAPKISVTLGKKALVKNTDYKVAYKNNVNVGYGKMIVKGIGKYAGVIETTFKIVPKGTEITKLSAKRTNHSVLVKWKKQATQTDGYQLYYTTKGKKAVTLTLPNTRTSKRVYKMKKGKTYSFRIRTYKIVGGKKIYSGWSQTKKIVAK